MSCLNQEKTPLSFFWKIPLIFDAGTKNNTFAFEKSPYLLSYYKTCEGWKKKIRGSIFCLFSIFGIHLSGE